MSDQEPRDYFITKSTEMEGAYRVEAELTNELTASVLGVLLKLGHSALAAEMSRRAGMPDEPTPDQLLDYLKDLVDEEIEMNNALGDYTLAAEHRCVKPDLKTGKWISLGPKDK